MTGIHLIADPRLRSKRRLALRGASRTQGTEILRSIGEISNVEGGLCDASAKSEFPLVGEGIADFAESGELAIVRRVEVVIGIAVRQQRLTEDVERVVAVQSLEEII